MAGPTAKLLWRIPSDDGISADVLITKPTGEEYQVTCLCRPNGTTEIGDHSGEAHLPLLTDEFGDQVILALCRLVTLGT